MTTKQTCGWSMIAVLFVLVFLFLASISNTQTAILTLASVFGMLGLLFFAAHLITEE